MDEIIRFVSDLPGTTAMTADEASGAPEIAWGDTFFYYDPPGAEPDRRMPFATIVIKDYPGFDTASHLDRPGVFRLNVGVGRNVYRELLGHPPAAHDQHRADYDYAALDQVIPHPTYAVQGWVSVLNPAAQTSGLVRELITGAHARAAGRRRGH